ncbi:GGDEF domain-containing protein [Blastococcus tunisiensis]|uniref:Diguanylate cyclase (GGDEF) domain-containing protein n=1 Tax=Blastococcus tunisiensis TaxID=1798228 RepID=A0A1I2GAN4_9ACTN|nr:GGDEF domain-containing protein [Blastococcus sp. DSM 46838]SFF14223.1 diguanylate cyclase (GGDEF) domain-containing protein [Blastococcus sp. DSM 46838]
MTGRWQPDLDRGIPPLGTAEGDPSTEHRVGALTLAGMLVLGALMGGINLLVDGVLTEGTGRWVYGATMVALLLMAVPLLVRQRADRWHMFALVLLGDLIYVVVVLCVDDPLRYATPLMLLFPAFVAAWFLGPWELGVNMVATTVACLVGLWPSYENAVGLAVQVGVSAGMLNTGALGVFVLRRRVQRLLVATETLTRLDPLTGLFNRRYLVEHSPRMWRQARRDGSRLAAMVLDLDHFKRLNDAYGHAAGDAVLREVAAALAAAVRPSDVLARTGGEELLVLGQVADPDEALHLAERLRAAVAGSVTPDGHAITASVGVALARPVDGQDPTDELWRLVDRADAAMYEAKQQGRDRVVSLWVPRARTPLAGGLVPSRGDAG